METILNNTARVYDFTFKTTGMNDSHTVKLIPGFNRITPEEYTRIKNNPLFKFLVDRASITVGSTGAGAVVEMAEPGTVPVPTPKKKKKVSTPANDAGDLDDFE
jgi:hypothetical protein